MNPLSGPQDRFIGTPVIFEAFHERGPGFLEDPRDSQFMKKADSSLRDSLNSRKGSTWNSQHKRPESEIAKTDRNGGSGDTRTTDHYIAGMLCVRHNQTHFVPGRRFACFLLAALTGGGAKNRTPNPSEASSLAARSSSNIKPRAVAICVASSI